MTPSPEHADPGCSFEALEREQLRLWMQLDTSSKIDFFEEMIAIAYQSGALTPERLALRDRAPASIAGEPR
jgi:hypothetical protein